MLSKPFSLLILLVLILALTTLGALGEAAKPQPGITWRVEMVSQLRPDECIHEDSAMRISGMGDLGPGQVAEYPIDGSLPRLEFCMGPYGGTGGNAGIAVMVEGRGDYSLEFITPDGTVLPGHPWERRGSLRGFRRGAAPKWYCPENPHDYGHGKDCLGGLYQVRLIAGDKKVNKVCVWILVNCAWCPWQKNYLDPLDWNIVEYNAEH